LLGVIASMQGIHCTSDAPYVIARLGSKRAEKALMLAEADEVRCGGEQWNGYTVEDVDPIACFYASVSRKLRMALFLSGSADEPDGGAALVYREQCVQCV